MRRRLSRAGARGQRARHPTSRCSSSSGLSRRERARLRATACCRCRGARRAGAWASVAHRAPASPARRRAATAKPPSATATGSARRRGGGGGRRRATLSTAPPHRRRRPPACSLAARARASRWRAGDLPATIGDACAKLLACSHTILLLGCSLWSTPTLLPIGIVKSGLGSDSRASCWLGLACPHTWAALATLHAEQARWGRIAARCCRTELCILQRATYSYWDTPTHDECPSISVLVSATMCSSSAAAVATCRQIMCLLGRALMIRLTE